MFKGQFRKIKYHPVAKQTWPNPLAKAGCYIQPYVPEIEVAMRHFYNSLDEKGRRRYAGIEALKLGLGGRKPYTQHWENIDEKFLEVLHEHTAGDPMDVKVRWTDLTPRRDYDRFAGRSWHSGQSLRCAPIAQETQLPATQSPKKCTMKKDIPNRNAQFENITRLTAEYQTAGNSILSMDTKKKEHLGNFYREGHLYTLETLLTNDHDFTSIATGIIIQHSLYDQE